MIELERMLDRLRFAMWSILILAIVAGMGRGLHGLGVPVIQDAGSAVDWPILFVLLLTFVAGWAFFWGGASQDILSEREKLLKKTGEMKFDMNDQRRLTLEERKKAELFAYLGVTQQLQRTSGDPLSSEQIVYALHCIARKCWALNSYCISLQQNEGVDAPETREIDEQFRRARSAFWGLHESLKDKKLMEFPNDDRWTNHLPEDLREHERSEDKVAA